MNERTKSILNWAAALIIAVGVLLLILFPKFYEPTSLAVQKSGYVITNPSMILLEYTTRNAISQFGGDMSMRGFNSALLFGLMGIAITIVLTPSLMVFGLKKSEHSSGPFHPVTWHLSTGIILAAISMGIYSSITWTVSNEQIYKHADRQQALNQLRFELMDLSFDASVEAILPHDKGGGEGSFKNFISDDGSARNMRLSDLDRYNPNSNFDFVIKDSVTDSSLTIIGVTDYEGENPDLRNADGRTGRVQLSVTVNPYTDPLIHFEQENERYFTSNTE